MRSQLLIAAAVLAALPTVAGAQATRRPAEIRFQAMDRNGDRTITRQEWQGSDRSFVVHDWNGDGVLSGEEVRVGARRQRSNAPDYDGGEFYDWTARGFTSVDHNRDGRITRQEWHFDQEGFYRADHNRDGVLTRSEFLGEARDDDRDDRFAYLDADDNGRIERDEWHSTAAEFTRLDRNRDGRLTPAELGSVDVNANRPETFAGLDINRNGTISFNEWHWSRASFDQRDANSDGVLSRNELAAAGTVGTSGLAGRPIRVPATEPWTDSGITVRRGQTIEIDASGTVTLSGPSDSATPAGSISGRQAPAAPVPNRSAGGLLLRIADAPPIFVGANSAFEAPASGRVYFGVNDDHLADNAGEFRVVVRVR